MNKSNPPNLPHVKGLTTDIKSKVLKQKRTRQTELQQVIDDHNFKIFAETLNSKYSVNIYTYTMNNFLKFTITHTPTITIPSDLLKIKKELLQEILEKYLLDIKNKISTSYVKLCMASIRSFLEFHDVSYNKKRLNKLLPPKNKPSGGKPYTADQLDIIVKGASGLKLKSMILVCASSGMRSEAVVMLKYGDLIPIDDTYGVIAYHNNVEDPTAEYITFMTNEARTMLDTYTSKRVENGEQITSESYVFPLYNDPLSPLPASYFAELMLRLGKQITKNLEKNTRVKRYDIQAVHGMRKFFDHAMHRAIVVIDGVEYQAIGEDWIERMMGHRSTTRDLKQRYYDKDIDGLYKEYKKAIPYLEITKEIRQARIIKNLQTSVTQPPVMASSDTMLMQKAILELQEKVNSFINKNG